jgi:hypothetical protein
VGGYPRRLTTVKTIQTLVEAAAGSLGADSRIAVPRSVSKPSPGPQNSGVASPYSRAMLPRALRAVSRLLLGLLLLWAARLLSHSKVPEPEGEWRAIAESELVDP